MMIKQHRKLLRQALGFTLVEVLVALVISTVVIGGAFSVFVNTKKTQRFTGQLSQLQESGRFALNFLKKDIRMVGYQGCNSYKEPAVNFVANALTQAEFDQQKIIGFEIASGWAAGSAFNGKITAVTGTDAISVARFADLNRTNVFVSQTATTLEVANTPAIDISPISDKLVAISDCKSTDILKLTTSVATGTPNATLTYRSTTAGGNIISKPYAVDGTKISTYSRVIYFIGDTNRTNERGEAIYALYQATAPFNASDTQELIEGVENMQILYGETLSTGNIRYVQADNSTPAINWANVKSIKITLLVATQQGVRNTDDTSDYQLLATAVKAPATGVSNPHSGGRRLRKIFSTTINIRNRVE